MISNKFPTLRTRNQAPTKARPVIARYPSPPQNASSAPEDSVRILPAPKAKTPPPPTSVVKEQAQVEAKESKLERKEPKSQGMREMLENMQNPVGSPKMMVDNKGLIVFEDVTEREMPGWKEEQKTDLTRTASQSEPTSRSPKLTAEMRNLIARSLGAGDNVDLAVGVVEAVVAGSVLSGVVPFGAVAIGATAGGFVGSGLLPFPLGGGLIAPGPHLGVNYGQGKAGTSGSSGNGSRIVSTEKKPREGSDMAEMVANIKSPKSEVALGVDKQGRVALLQEPYGTRA